MGRDQERYREEMRMGSRDQVYGSVSSLVVRPTDSGGSGHGNDYEPGEIRRDERHGSSYHEQKRGVDRFRHSEPGYDMKGYKTSGPEGSGSPMHHRKIGPPYGHDFDRSVPPRGRGFRGGRGRGRFQDRSPPPGIGRGRPPLGRGYGGPGYGPPEPFGGENIGRNNPNVAPREGDWICSEPTCGNLNFARRTHCNNCNKPRRDMAPFGIGIRSPQRGFQGPPPPHPPPMRRGPPMGRGMGRGMNGFGAPPIGWGRGGQREFDQGPPPRPGERFSDFRSERDTRDRPDYRDHDDYRERERFDRPTLVDWGYTMGSRDREREDRFHDKRGAHDARSDRRPPSPPPRSRWARDVRDRSQSPPIRSASKDYYRESYLDRRRDDKRSGQRDRMDDAYQLRLGASS